MKLPWEFATAGCRFGRPTGSTLVTLVLPCGPADSTLQHHVLLCHARASVLSLPAHSFGSFMKMGLLRQWYSPTSMEPVGQPGNTGQHPPWATVFGSHHAHPPKGLLKLCLFNRQELAPWYSMLCLHLSCCPPTWMPALVLAVPVPS